jgi:hypothetical protein
MRRKYPPPGTVSFCQIRHCHPAIELVLVHRLLGFGEHRAAEILKAGIRVDKAFHNASKPTVGKGVPRAKDRSGWK